MGEFTRVELTPRKIMVLARKQQNYFSRDGESGRCRFCNCEKEDFQYSWGEEKLYKIIEILRILFKNFCFSDNWKIAENPLKNWWWNWSCTERCRLCLPNNSQVFSWKIKNSFFNWFCYLGGSGGKNHNFLAKNFNC